MQLRVEPQETKSLPLEVETEGTPEKGFILFDASSEQNQVIVSGPRSYVNKVGRAVASVDITGSERSINSFPEVILYDEDGKVITDEEIKTEKLHLNISSVKVVATIYKTKEVPITCGQEVPIAYGYEMESNPAVEPPSVTVAGAAGILRDFDAIEIPVEDIAVDPVDGNMHKVFKIKSYLPDGVFLTDDSPEKVTVYIRVQQQTVEETYSDTYTDTGSEDMSEGSEEGE